MFNKERNKKYMKMHRLSQLKYGKKKFQKKVENNDNVIPRAFVEAVSDKTVAPSSSQDNVDCYDGEDGQIKNKQDLDLASSDTEINSVDQKSESVAPRLMLGTRLSLIPESVSAALTNIQRSQLRRVREEASVHLEGILRNVIKTVDNYISREQGLIISSKKMIGENEEEEEEKRITGEIQKIMKGYLTKKKTGEELVEESDQEKPEEKTERKANKQDFGKTNFIEPQVPICQMMLEHIDELFHTNDKRNVVLNEVYQWLDNYPSGSITNSAVECDDVEEIVEPSKLFGEWQQQNNIKRLISILKDMGMKIPKSYDAEDENKGETQRNLLEEKMKKQRSKFVYTKVHDAETLTEPRNWAMAAKTVQQILEEAAVSATNNKTKLTITNGLKQFQFMTILTEKRNEERMKLNTQLDNIQGKWNREKNETKILRKKKNILESQIEKQEDELVELKKDIEVKDAALKEQETRIQELEVLQEEKETPEPKIIYQQVPQPTPAPVEPAAVKEKEPAAPASQPTKPKAVKTTPAQKPRAPQVPPATKSRKEKEKEQAAEKKAKEKEKEEAAKTTVIMSLKEAKKELEEIRKAGQARENQIKELKLKIQSEAEKYEQEKVQLSEEVQFHKKQTESAKRQLELEQEIWDQVKAEMTQEKEKLSSELQEKEEIINYQEQRIQEVAREMTLSLMRAGLKNTSTGRENATDKLMESKQMLAKLHLQYEYELEKLRGFVERESERHRADMRKMEQDHRRDLTIIYRDTSVILRAVNRFKYCLANMLDRENLPDAAHGIRNITNLIEDETTTDPHIKLARMAGNVIELMIQMEFKMSQAFMNKRMEIKDTSLEKNFISKDLETREELLRKARELGNLQAEKLKSVREELTTQETQFLKLKRMEEDKLTDISERNKELTRQNQILNKELTALQKETQEENTKKENQISEMGKANGELQKNLEEQEIIISSLRAENTRIINEQKMYLKKSDMLRNIKLLNDAYATKKISQEKHMVAVAMLEKTMNVSAARFVHFVQKYMIHQSWKKICDTMVAFRKGKKRHPRVEKYLKTVEKNIEQKKNNLEKRREELLKKRTEIYMHFRNMCNELIKENGIILVRPAVQKDVVSCRSEEQEWMINKKYQKVLQPRKSMAKKKDMNQGEIGELKGMPFVAPQISEQSSWEFPAIQTTHSAIVTPKILALDINKARESASQRVLTSQSCDTFVKQGKSEIKMWYQRKKEREVLFILPSIASMYSEN